MKARRTRRAVIVALWLIVGCSPAREQTKEAAADPTANADAASGQAAHDQAARSGRQELRLVLTTDEHGWLLPFDDEEKGEIKGGMAGFAAALMEETAGRDNAVLLSVGDMWTGPYESTTLEGAPMVRAFNELGYKAAAVGNHEFDFGVRTLAKRASEAKFPFLAANIVEAATGETPSWAKPWAVIDVGGVKLGVVGLANSLTNEVTDPRHTVGLEFQSYDKALRKAVPAVRAAGAEHVVVLLHARVAAAQALLPVLRELDVHVIGAGHAHRAAASIDLGGTIDVTSDDVVICNGGPYLRSYCRIDLAFEDGKLVDRAVVIPRVTHKVGADAPVPPEAIAAIVKQASAQASAAGREVLARSKTAITRKSGALGQLVVDGWLEALPFAQAAITNAGGLRQDLPRGKVRVRDVVSVMPFNNFLVVIEVTGAQLKEALENPESIAAGVSFTYREVDGRRLIEEMVGADGKRIEPETRLKVIVNDFMYRGGDRYKLRQYDPEPEETAVDWREPVMRKLRALGEAKKPITLQADERARLVK